MLHEPGEARVGATLVVVGVVHHRQGDGVGEGTDILLSVILFYDTCLEIERSINVQIEILFTFEHAVDRPRAHGGQEVDTQDDAAHQGDQVAEIVLENGLQSFLMGSYLP